MLSQEYYVTLRSYVSLSPFLLLSLSLSSLSLSPHPSLSLPLSLPSLPPFPPPLHFQGGERILVTFPHSVPSGERVLLVFSGSQQRHEVVTGRHSPTSLYATIPGMVWTTKHTHVSMTKLEKKGEGEKKRQGGRERKGGGGKKE